MKTTKTILFLFIFISSGFVSCNQESIENDEIKKIDLDEKSAKLIDADNAFGLEIFQKIRTASTNENLMISPLSISVALAMAYNGADTQTKTEMESAMKLAGLSTSEINGSYKMLIDALKSLDKDVTFEIANAIYYAKGFSVKSGFLDIIKTVYKAEISALDFSSSSAVSTINNWVAAKTHDKIKSIIDQLNPLDRMVLLNAIYFNGTWTKKFDKDGTHNLTFTKTNGSFMEVPMMNKTDSLKYTSNSLFRAVKLPYGKGQYNMIVVLPADGKNSRDVISKFNAPNWTGWMESFELKPNVEVTMPRFKFVFDSGLIEVLKLMGMHKAFQATIADFSKISDIDLYISDIRHKSFIDVNETGTEAAAVTSITFTTTSIGNEPPKIQFFVNKPFVFAITEKDTNVILFIGEVNYP